MTAAAVLTIAGHDPGGGAGIQADIEAIRAQGLGAYSVVTALTVQDTQNVRRVQAVAPEWLAETLQVLLDDCPVHAIKIGLIGSAAQVPVIVMAIERADAFSVLDPVLRAGGGAALADTALQAAIVEQLLPHVSLMTPNAAEARALTGCAELDAAGARLLALGARDVLITGGDEPGDTVCNHWFSESRSEPVRFRFPRLAGGFHGAGCTLSAALAARLALGEALPEALERAQRYTARTLAAAHRPGRGRAIPQRLFLGGEA